MVKIKLKFYFKFIFFKFLGLIFATGENNGLVRIWDISSQNPVLTLECHNTEISGLSFSENGYYLATSAMKDNVVKIVDLRKSEVVRKIELPEKHYEVRSVKFDHSGSYLGIAGSSVHLYGVKSNSLFAQFNEHTDLVTDFAFGQDCHNFATTSLDRNLKIFS
jgi:pre-mRNA-processing factor 19